MAFVVWRGDEGSEAGVQWSSAGVLGTARVRSTVAAKPLAKVPAKAEASKPAAKAETAKPAAKAPIPRPRVKLDAIEIISGVPLPPNLRGAQDNAYGALLAKMQPGDHVALPERNAKSMASHARGLGIKVATRKLVDGRFGVWRVA